MNAIYQSLKMTGRKLYSYIEQGSPMSFLQLDFVTALTKEVKLVKSPKPQFC